RETPNGRAHLRGGLPQSCSFLLLVGDGSDPDYRERVGWCQLASGKVKATRAPPSARFSAQIRPPCACTRPCAIARPRPAPPFERARESSARQKRSNIRCGTSLPSPSPLSSTATIA